MRVLIVEDDAELRETMSRTLREAGYDVESAATGAEGDAAAAAGGYDAILLDWVLPGISGLDICRRLREARDTSPVIMVTAKDEVTARIEGLDAGADDYLVKPFDIGELLARIRSVVRRGGSQRTATFVAGPVVLDVRNRIVAVHGAEVQLSVREFDLLEFLMRNAGVALPREMIEERVWGGSFESGSNVVDVFIRRVRQRLGEQAGRMIQSVRGVGYRIRLQ